MKKNSKKKGFTLIELIVVIAILGILAAVLIPKFTGFTNKAQGSSALVSAKQFATAYDSLVAEGKTWAAAAATGKFITDDVMKLAGLTASNGAVSDVDDTGSFKWTAAASQGGKVAGRTGTGEVHIIP